MIHCRCLTQKWTQIQSLYVICRKDLRSKDSQPRTRKIKSKVEARGLCYIPVFFLSLCQVLKKAFCFTEQPSGISEFSYLPESFGIGQGFV